MNGQIVKIRNTIFLVLIVIFAILVAIVFMGLGRSWGPKMPPSAMLYFGVAFFVLAAVLVVMTIKIKESGIRKIFFILTGASAVGIPICAVLHNLFYALCVKFGWGFWIKGGDEALFFILASFGLPGIVRHRGIGKHCASYIGDVEKKRILV